MIDGELRVSERDGEPVVVDVTSAVTVCHQHAQHRGGTGRDYHHIDTDHFVTTGEISPACGCVNPHQDVTWLPCRQRDLDGIWEGYSYQACFGDYDPCDPTSTASGHDGLTATLTDMTVEEFDAADAAHNGGGLLMQGDDTRSILAFPEIEARLGYNPARFLDQPSQSDFGDTSPLATAQALIRGMDDLKTVRAWRDVEIALGRGTNGNPLQRVVRKLNKRQAQFEADTPNESLGAEDAAPESSRDVDTAPTAAETPQAVKQPPGPASTTTGTEMVLATDGGAALRSASTCPVCGSDLETEDIAGDTGCWCPQESDFWEPASAAETVEGSA